ncbi:MAG: hypothetical protein C4575_01725 [Desulforudis sp.]|jgi:hypothetical protein|nr:MAG: hypothetical protein C4575_01725 [Desulforudis sp.]
MLKETPLLHKDGIEAMEKVFDAARAFCFGEHVGGISLSPDAYDLFLKLCKAVNAAEIKKALLGDEKR